MTVCPHLIPGVTVKVKVAQSCLTLCHPMVFSSPWNSLGQNPGMGSLSLLQEDLPSPGITPRSPALQVDALPVKPQGKPKNTGMGSLSLLQEIFPTQESNWGLLHCRRILYLLSYQEDVKGNWRAKVTAQRIIFGVRDLNSSNSQLLCIKMDGK